MIYINIMHSLYKTRHIVHDYFSKTNLAEHPERFVLIGFIAADGCISKAKYGQRRLQINLAAQDKNVLEIFNAELSASTRSLSHVKKSNSYIWYIPSNQVCDDLASYNIIPRKTAIYELPTNITDDQMPYFLRGYFYGDGCVYGEGAARNYHLISNRLFATQLSEYLTSKNIVDRCPLYEIKKSKYVQIHMKGRQGARFSKYIFFNDVLKLLPRKHIISNEVVKASRWNLEEINLVTQLDLEEFCNLTGRTLTSAKSMRDRILYRPHLIPLLRKTHS